MVSSVTVRPKPKKNISSVTTTPELKTAFGQFSSGSKHVITLPGRIYEGQSLSGAPHLRTKVLKPISSHFNHMTTDPLQHRKLY